MNCETMLNICENYLRSDRFYFDELDVKLIRG